MQIYRKKHYLCTLQVSGCGAVGSVPALGAGGPAFEPRYPDKKQGGRFIPAALLSYLQACYRFIMQLKSLV